MMKNRTALIYALLMGLIGIFLAGCATGQSGVASAASQSDLLKQAGFRVYTAKSPDKLTYIQTLPAKKVVMNQYQNKTLYLVCTNSDSKQCFLGDEAAYAQYQKLATQVCLDENQCQVSEKRWDPEAVQMWADSQGAG